DELWNLPVFRWFSNPKMTLFPQVEEVTTEAVVVPLTPACSVEPVPTLTDPDAIEFEGMVGVGPVVDVERLTPPTTNALNRFEQLVSKSGGALKLTSAYRPVTYQQHLRDVWYKW